MTEKHTRTTTLRDVRVSDDVGRMYELGRFDREFAAFGVAYLEEGQRRYLVSAQLSKITDFIEHCRRRGLCTSFIGELHESHAVPSGTRELITQAVKKKLAQGLRDAYPQAFLQELTALAQAVTTNEAQPLLRQWQEHIDGRFDADELAVFEGALICAYDSRVLNQAAYEELSRWLAQVRRDMADDVIPSDVLETTFYGIAYQVGGQTRCVVNTHREVLFKRRCELEQQGHCVTPLFAQRRGYNYQYGLPDARDDFEKALRRIYDERYFQALQALHALRRRSAQPPAAADLSARLDHTHARYGAKAAELLRCYGRTWGVL